MVVKSFGRAVGGDCKIDAGVAQLVERFTCNEDVAGLSPVSSFPESQKR